MYKENKCFFSVSLENGITITGDNPDMVKSFLSDVSICIGDAIDSGLNDNHINWKAQHIIELKCQLDDAWSTIYNNQTKERNKTMEKYDYLEAVTADAKQWLLDHYEIEFLKGSEDYSTFYEEMFVTDSVTGNASGSYTFSTWQAEENLCHNMHLLERAADESNYNEIPREWIENAETADVIIRCYYLGEAINNAMEEIKEENK